VDFHAVGNPVTTQMAEARGTSSPIPSSRRKETLFVVDCGSPYGLTSTTVPVRVQARVDHDGGTPDGVDLAGRRIGTQQVAVANLA
jgi:hypothetical protein